MVSRTPSPEARVLRTSIVCGWQSEATKKSIRLLLCCAMHIAMASAAAVPSSSNEAPAMGSAVRSQIIVWKLRRASSLPCDSSAWYGVYWVYQHGFSTTVLRMTVGVTVP